MPDRSREPNQSSDPRLPRSSNTVHALYAWGRPPRPRVRCQLAMFTYFLTTYSPVPPVRRVYCGSSATRAVRVHGMPAWCHGACRVDVSGC